MSVNSYLIDVLPSNDPAVIKKCLIAEPYTGIYMGQDLDGTIHCTVAETVTYADMKTAIEANHPPPGTLSHDAADPLVIVGDGVATSVVTLSDPRGASASGKTVKLRIPAGALIKVDADSFVLDASGDVLVTFGPCTGCLGDVKLEFYYVSGEADSVFLNLRFGSA